MHLLTSGWILMLLKHTISTSQFWPPNTAKPVVPQFQ
jgi:hypothetical protein